MAASTIQNYKAIVKDLSEGKISPLYYLHGEEDYFIDQLVNKLDEEGMVLAKGEADFNRAVLYGGDTKGAKILTECRSFPVMAQRRLVIVREAQKLKASEWDTVAPYLYAPAASTVLVLAFKGKFKGLPAAIAKKLPRSKCQRFAATRLWEKDIHGWLDAWFKEIEITADREVPAIVTNHLGTNLGFIENELKKMLIYLKATKQTQLTRDIVYEMINVDKAFNSFELINALSTGKAFQAHLIMDRLSSNTKVNPPVMILSALFRFFHNLALLQQLRILDVNGIKSHLHTHYYAALDYVEASKRYSWQQVHLNIAAILEADMQIKGVTPTSMSDEHALKTLVMKLIA